MTGTTWSSADRIFRSFDQYVIERTPARRLPGFENRPIAYFSTEFSLHETLPIYAGGLGSFRETI
jgi:glucan phosphorylase